MIKLFHLKAKMKKPLLSNITTMLMLGINAVS